MNMKIVNRRVVAKSLVLLPTFITLDSSNANPMLFISAAINLGRKILLPVAVNVLTARLANAKVQPPPTPKTFHDEFGAPIIVNGDYQNNTECGTQNYEVLRQVRYGAFHRDALCDVNELEIYTIISPRIYDRFRCVPIPVTPRRRVDNVQSVVSATQNYSGASPAKLNYTRDFEAAGQRVAAHSVTMSNGKEALIFA